MLAGDVVRRTDDRRSAACARRCRARRHCRCGRGTCDAAPANDVPQFAEEARVRLCCDSVLHLRRLLHLRPESHPSTQTLCPPRRNTRTCAHAHAHGLAHARMRTDLRTRKTMHTHTHARTYARARRPARRFVLEALLRGCGTDRHTSHLRCTAGSADSVPPGSRLLGRIMRQCAWTSESAPPDAAETEDRGGGVPKVALSPSSAGPSSVGRRASASWTCSCRTARRFGAHQIRVQTRVARKLKCK